MIEYGASSNACYGEHVAGHPLPMRQPNEPPSTQGPPPEASGLSGRERRSKRAEDTPAASSRSSQRAITSSRSQRAAGPSIEETRGSEEDEEGEEGDGESMDAFSSLAVVPDPSHSGSACPLPTTTTSLQ